MQGMISFRPPVGHITSTPTPTPTSATRQRDTRPVILSIHTHAQTYTQTLQEGGSSEQAYTSTFFFLSVLKRTDMELSSTGASGHRGISPMTTWTAGLAHWDTLRTA